MERNVRTYDHFCLAARALERVGERWSLLVIRDLLTGPKRFTDLMERLGGITPKTLTQRLRELADAGIVSADRRTGRREVWYRLTPAGTELAPIIDTLNEWGLRHAWRRPRPGERLHVEHLLRAILAAPGDGPADHRPARWHFHFPGADYLAETDGGQWSLATRAPDRQPEATVATRAGDASAVAGKPDRQPDLSVVAGKPDRQPDLSVVASPETFLPFAIDPSAQRASELGIQLVGDRHATERFLRRLRDFAKIATETGGDGG